MSDRHYNDALIEPLRRHRGDLVLDLDTLPDGRDDGIEGLGQVAARFLEDIDRGHEHLHVVRNDALGKVDEGLFEGDTQVVLAQDQVELLLDRDATVSLPDDQPWATPVFWAERKGHTAILERLRQIV